MEQTKKEILIDEYIYDVHDFKHVNSRADAGFKEFHQNNFRNPWQLFC